MTTIALYNLKGGVGKTASCVNLAYLAAADGFKTLLWDIDQQGSSSFYYKAKPKMHPGIKKLITKDADLESAILSTDFELLDVKGYDPSRPYAIGGDEDIITVAAVEQEEYLTIPKMERKISGTKKAMEKAARDLDFMEAARLRDEMFRLQKELEAMKK